MTDENKSLYEDMEVSESIEAFKAEEARLKETGELSEPLNLVMFEITGAIAKFSQLFPKTASTELAFVSFVDGWENMVSMLAAADIERKIGSENEGDNTEETHS